MEGRPNDNARYIKCGDNIIKVIDHFSPSGKTFCELLNEFILREAQKSEKKAA